MSGELITFGGVRLDKNDVAYKETVTDRDGNKHYFVIFKNGMRVAYQGANGKDAHINVSDYKIKYSGEQNYLAAKGIKGLEIDGAYNKSDHIDIRESSIIGINVSDNGDLTDSVNIRNSQSTFGARVIPSVKEDYHYGDGKIEADSRDSIFIDDVSKGLRNKVDIKR